MNLVARLSARNSPRHHILDHTASYLTVCQGLLHLLGNWELLNGKQWVVIQTGRLLRLSLRLVTLQAPGAAATELVAVKHCRSEDNCPGEKNQMPNRNISDGGENV